MAVPFENRNFHKEMLKLAGQLQKEGKVPRLLLHSCCAPCSSNCIEVLSKYFMVTVFYYNPNISSDEEYKKRVAEQIRFIKEFDTPNKVEFIEGDYEPDVFFKEVKGLEKEPEGGKRCFKCYELRLRKTAELAKAEAYDETGLKLQEEYGVNYLLSDFKKQEGYKRSIELSKEYGLYRQNYCGCVYSRQQILMSK